MHVTSYCVSFFNYCYKASVHHLSSVLTYGGFDDAGSSQSREGDFDGISSCFVLVLFILICTCRLDDSSSFT